MPEGISFSTTAYNNAARCLKRFEYRHELGLIPRPKDVRPKIRRGTWIHRCLQLSDLGIAWWDELDRMYEWAIRNEVDPVVAVATRDETYALCHDYLAFWSQREHKEGGPYQTVATEIPLEYTPIAGKRITATIDRIVSDPKGHHWIWERKSTEDMPDSDWRNIDPQTIIQLACARLGHDMNIAGIVFDYIRTEPGPRVKVYKPDKKNQRGGHLYDDLLTKAVTPRAFEAAVPEIRAQWQPDPAYAEGPEQYINAMRVRMVQPEAWFQRYPVLRPDEMMTETLKDVAVKMGDVIRARKSGHYSRSVAITDCRLFCPYMKLCFREYALGRPSEALREELFTIETPELRAEGRSDVA